MKENPRCVGYVKPMVELPKITAVDAELQKDKICDFACKHDMCLERFYCEESSDAVTEYMNLIDAAVHREFDALILDNIYCFGQALFSVADFIENVMMPLGFQVYIVSDGMNFGCDDFDNYLSYSREYMRLASATHSLHKYNASGVKKKRHERRIVFEAQHSLEWYEARQTELFQEMLRFPENFDALEEEMQLCRKAIKKLKV